LSVNEGQSVLYGEVAIADFLIGEKNKILSSNH
jgi:methionyl-tRNA synthetase